MRCAWRSPTLPPARRVTGWDDYNYINGSTQVGQNDAVGQAAVNSFQTLPEPSCLLVLLATGAVRFCIAVRSDHVPCAFLRG